MNKENKKVGKEHFYFNDRSAKNSQLSVEIYNIGKDNKLGTTVDDVSIIIETHCLKRLGHGAFIFKNDEAKQFAETILKYLDEEEKGK